MSERIAMEAPVFDDGKERIVMWFRARKMAGLWWSREGVTRTSTAMFGAWEALASRERDNRKPLTIQQNSPFEEEQ
jgi:hypothetical protein